MKLRTKGLQENARRCFQTSERSCQVVMKNAALCNDGLCRGRVTPSRSARVNRNTCTFSIKRNRHHHWTIYVIKIHGINMLAVGKKVIVFLLYAHSARKTSPYHLHAPRQKEHSSTETHTLTHTKWWCHQMVHPLPRKGPFLLHTIIFLSEPSSSQSPCSSHSHFTPTELIRGGGCSCIQAEYTL